MRVIRSHQSAIRTLSRVPSYFASATIRNSSLTSPVLHRSPHSAFRFIRNTIAARASLGVTATSRPVSTSAFRIFRSGRAKPKSYQSGLNYTPSHPELLRSSMYARGLGAALVSVLGYGAWTVYMGNDTTNSFGLSQSTTTPAANVGDASQQVRQVLVVSANELHTGTWVGDGPISKQIDGDGRRVIEMLTPDQATQKLRKHEQSYFVNRGQGVIRYDLVQVGSNDPIEDDHSERIIEVPNKILQESQDGTTDWSFWGVFDGHSGWTTSAKLRQSLIRYVAREVNNSYHDASTTANGEKPSPDTINAAIKKGFTQLDDEIVHQAVDLSLKAKSKNKAAELLAPALSGSCAILSFYDPISKTLRVACTGDSRAVLGRKLPNGKWTVTSLSNDQTGSNPDEAARLRKEHPGEENKVVRNGRVLGGLEPTRAFGDAVYKWSRDIHAKLRDSFFVRGVSPDLLTPPYVTAEPVITSTKIEPQNGDFIVMATDGLWEMLSNEEVVGLVGKWIEAQHANGGSLVQQDSKGQGSAVWSKLWGSTGKTSSGLPVEENSDASSNGQKAPIRQQQWKARPAEERFIVKDKNVATHLVRNALGGRNEEQLCALLTLPSPYSRRYRDDLTVNVIFFGEQQGASGMIEVNEEATVPVQPKL